jgi:hypothetical protein
MFQRFSVTKREHDPYTRELIVGSTSLEETLHGVALAKFKEHLGLKGPGQWQSYCHDACSHVPFPYRPQFCENFADTFKNAALEEIEVCHSFFLSFQGT